MKPILKIFVRDDCFGCVAAQEIAVRVEQDHPQLKVELVNIADPKAIVPETVFATPTYMLDNRIVSLGNPSLVEVAEWVTRMTLTLL